MQMLFVAVRGCSPASITYALAALERDDHALGCSGRFWPAAMMSRMAMGSEQGHRGTSMSSTCIDCEPSLAPVWSWQKRGVHSTVET
jgi:hypothetical protein